MRTHAVSHRRFSNAFGLLQAPAGGDPMEEGFGNTVGAAAARAATAAAGRAAGGRANAAYIDPVDAATLGNAQAAANQ